MLKSRKLTVPPHVLTYHTDWEPIIDSLETAYSEIAPWLLRDTIEPQPDNIFKQLEVPLKDKRVCVVGIDPYPNGATGIPFESPDFTKKSAIAIAGAISRASGIRHYSNFYPRRIPGVIVWNYYLSCRRGESKSHAMYWDRIARTLLTHIARYVSVFYFLGRTDFGNVRSRFDVPVTIVLGYHPAARGNQFASDRCLEIINILLEINGESTIDWGKGLEDV